MLEIVPSGTPAPELPPAAGVGWRRETKDVWRRFWASPVAQTVDRASDWQVVHRWITYVDEWFRCMRVVRRNRLVPGSMGQVRVNPLYTVVLNLEQRIARVEEKLGMTPLDRMRLGIDYAAAQRSLEGLNDDLNEADDEEELMEGYAGTPAPPRQRGGAGG